MIEGGEEIVKKIYGQVKWFSLKWEGKGKFILRGE